MENLTTLIWLFPLVFMLHDFEEIIVQRRWIDRHRAGLQQRYPFLKNILARMGGLTTTAFAIAVAEEFILISLVTGCAAVCRVYLPWVVLFMAFAAHLAVHLVQFLFLRRYHPALITTLMALPYALYTVYKLTGAGYTPAQLLLGTAAGLVLMALNLGLIHKVAPRIDRAIARSLSGKKDLPE